jgi:plasmid stabilization system protein ParE
MVQVVFHPEANIDFIEAIVWYEKQQKNLGQRFNEAVNSVIDRILKQPELFHIVKQNFREASVSVFPYTIVYRFNKRKKIVVIAAIYHAKRNPNLKFRN